MFKQEKMTLITILAIFDISIALRCVSDILMARANSKGNFKFWPTVYSLAAPEFFDLVPICCILYIHSLNFKVIRNDKDITDGNLNST